MYESILLIEDEQDLRLTITDRLENEGYRVESSEDGLGGYERALSASFDLLILDIMLPRKSGFDICRDIRSAGRKMPILMLTARGQLVDRVLGLKLGADDYLVKPFEMAELIARIEALLRRSATVPESGQPVHQFGNIRIDIRGTEVSRAGKVVALSAREFQLLQYLVEHRGATLSRTVILKEVWGYSTAAYTRTLDVHIFGLRQKLEDDPKNPKLILTVPGLGYKFSG